jgi:hypothetical protein
VKRMNSIRTGSRCAGLSTFATAALRRATGRSLAGGKWSCRANADSKPSRRELQCGLADRQPSWRRAKATSTSVTFPRRTLAYGGRRGRDHSVGVPMVPSRCGRQLWPARFAVAECGLRGGGGRFLPDLGLKADGSIVGWGFEPLMCRRRIRVSWRCCRRISQPGPESGRLDRGVGL